jgi:hypothetical protein
VHDAWWKAYDNDDDQLVPKLFECQQLPGRWSMVVMELLGADWLQYDELPGSQKADVKVAVLKALERAHRVEVPINNIRSDSNGGVAAHGDVRAPNVMVRRNSDVESSKNWLVRFIDLDWAGVVGAARYPSNMNTCISWADGAGPCQLLQQQHDVYMAQKL